MSVSTVQRIDASTQTEPVTFNDYNLKTSSKIVLHVALAVLSASIGAVAAAVGFTFTAVYGAVIFGVVATALTCVIAHHLFMKSLMPRSQPATVSEKTKETISSEIITEKKEKSPEHFYKALREQCRKDLQHRIYLSEKYFHKIDKKLASKNLTDDQRATLTTMSWVGEIIIPKNNAPEFVRETWEKMYSSYDKTILRSIRVNEAIRKQATKNEKIFEHDDGEFNRVRNIWMRSVQNVEKYKIGLERFKNSSKAPKEEIEKLTLKLAEAEKYLAKNEKAMDEKDSLLIQGESEYQELVK